MHHIFFATKRVHHRSLAKMRPLAGVFGLTPARFDMLYAIAPHAYGISQVDLCRVLGVTGATVSRMARSLQDLGFIVRARCTSDKRKLRSRLSEIGRRIFEAARRIIIEEDVIEPIVRRAFAVKWSTQESFAELLSFDAFLFRGRRRMHDTATLYYPWYPDRERPSDAEETVEEIAMADELERASQPHA
jgi:DNA-binding MarR family transcriptional regulator